MAEIFGSGTGSGVHGTGTGVYVTGYRLSTCGVVGGLGNHGTYLGELGIESVDGDGELCSHFPRMSRRF